MAVIPVEKKGGSLWPWLIGLLLLLVVIWFIWAQFDGDRERVNSTTPPAVTGAAADSSTMTDTAPTGTTGTGSTPGGSGDQVTEAGTYASTSDKLALVGRAAELSNVRVARVVGPKSFTLESGSEELLVIVDQNVNAGVGTQGKIDPGNTINLKGNFQRLQEDEIKNLSSNRFRDLTQQEREWLAKTPVYLHATEVGEIR